MQPGSAALVELEYYIDLFAVAAFCQFTFPWLGSACAVPGLFVATDSVAKLRVDCGRPTMASGAGCSGLRGNYAAAAPGEATSPGEAIHAGTTTSVSWGKPEIAYSTGTRSRSISFMAGGKQFWFCSYQRFSRYTAS